MKLFIQKLLVAALLIFSCSTLYAQSDSLQTRSLAYHKGQLENRVDDSDGQLYHDQAERLYYENLELKEQLSRQQTQLYSLQQAMAEQEMIIKQDTPLIYEQGRTIERQGAQLKDQKRKITAGGILGAVIVMFLISMQ